MNTMKGLSKFRIPKSVLRVFDNTSVTIFSPEFLRLWMVTSGRKFLKCQNNSRITFATKVKSSLNNLRMTPEPWLLSFELFYVGDGFSLDGMTGEGRMTNLTLKTERQRLGPTLRIIVIEKYNTNVVVVQLGIKNKTKQKLYEHCILTLSLNKHLFKVEEF